MTVECKKVRELSTNFEPDGVFVLGTHNGSIRIVGEDKSQCTVTATICVRAPTEGEAQQLAAEVNVELESEGERLSVKTKKPALSEGRSISVDFDVTIPARTILELVCHNGTVHVSNTTDDIRASTHNGSIYARGISGKRIELRTHNGAIEIDYTNSSNDKPDLSAETHNGNICLNAPSDLSARIAISTHNGSVASNIPMMVTRNTKGVLQGMVGKGDGEIHLGTHNGSVKVMAVPHGIGEPKGAGR